MRPIAVLLMLAGCTAAPAAPPLIDPDAVYALRTVDTAPFTARATIRFPEQDRIEGLGPCNSYEARQEAELPAFQIRRVRVGRESCDDAPAETYFLQTLGHMTGVELIGRDLVLSDEMGREMTFRRTP